MPGTGGKLYAEMVLDVNHALSSLNKFKQAVSGAGETGANSMRNVQVKIDKAKNSIDILSRGFSDFTNVIAGLGIANAFKSMVGAATEFELTTTILQRSFGDMADETESWARVVSKSFGVPLNDLRRAATSFNIILKSQLQNEAAAADLSRKLAEVGKNLSRAFGTDVEQALHAIQSGLIGINLPLHRFDIMIYEHTLAEYALQKGIEGTYKSLDNATKTWLRAQYIIEHASFATGLAAQQQKTLYGQIQILKTNVQALAVEIGNKLMPTIQGWVSGVNDLLDGFGRLRPGLREALSDIIGWGSAIAAAVLVLPPLVIGLLKLAGAYKALYGVVLASNVALNIATGLAFTQLAVLGKWALAVLAVAVAYGILAEAYDKFMGGKPLGDVDFSPIKAFQRALDDIAKGMDYLFMEPRVVKATLSDSLRKEVEDLFAPTRVLNLMSPNGQPAGLRVNPLNITGDRPQTPDNFIQKIEAAFRPKGGGGGKDAAEAAARAAQRKWEEESERTGSGPSATFDVQKMAIQVMKEKAIPALKELHDSIQAVLDPMGHLANKIKEAGTKIGQFASGSLGTLIGSMFGPLGQAIGPIVDIFLKAAPGFEHMMTGINGIIGGLGSILTPIIEILGAWFAILTPLMEAIGAVVMAFQPLIDIIGGAVFYIFKFLAIVVNGAAIALLTFAKWITLGLSSSVNKALEDAHKRQRKIYDMTYDSAKHASDEMERLAGATRNVPSWYKLANPRFQATSPAEAAMRTNSKFDWGGSGHKFGMDMMRFFDMQDWQKALKEGGDIRRQAAEALTDPEQRSRTAEIMSSDKPTQILIEKIIIENRGDNLEDTTAKIIQALRKLERMGYVPFA